MIEFIVFIIFVGTVQYITEKIMKIILSKNIKPGQKIKTVNGWRKIKQVTDQGAVISDGIVFFNERIYGWKAS